MATDGGVLVADTTHHRVVHWAPGAEAGTVVAGRRRSFFSTMLIRQIYKRNNEMRKTMFQNHRLSYDDDDLLRRKSPLASKRRETVQRGNDSARRPKCSVSAAPVESGRRDVGANSLLSTLLRYLASLLAGSTLASLMPPTKYNSSLSVAEKQAQHLEAATRVGGWVGG